MRNSFNVGDEVETQYGIVRLVCWVEREGRGLVTGYEPGTNMMRDTNYACMVCGSGNHEHGWYVIREDLKLVEPFHQWINQPKGTI